MDDDFKTVQLTGKRMAEQDNRGTQYPLFVIQNRIQRQPGIHEDADGVDHDDDGNELPFKYEYVFDLQAGIFFTQHAALKHLTENAHHYNKPKIYAVGAWRNPEMQAVMRSIIKAGDQEVPSHYA